MVNFFITSEKTKKSLTYYQGFFYEIFLLRFKTLTKYDAVSYSEAAFQRISNLV